MQAAGDVVGFAGDSGGVVGGEVGGAGAMSSGRPSGVTEATASLFCETAEWARPMSAR